MSEFGISLKPSIFFSTFGRALAWGIGLSHSTQKCRGNNRASSGIRTRDRRVQAVGDDTAAAVDTRGVARGFDTVTGETLRLKFNEEW